MHVHVFPHLLSCSFLQLKVEAIDSVCTCTLLYVCVCGQLTFNLGVQIVDYNLELSQCHVSQVGGLQASLH